jgi:tRNA modification GTPase
LAGRDAAIVSATAGTTRDVIEVRLDLAGFPILLADTAGLRDSTEAIEQEGVRRARAQAGQADIILLLLDGALWPKLDEASLAYLDSRCLLLLNKADLLGNAKPDHVRGHKLLPISTVTGEGLDALLASLTIAAEAQCSHGDEPALTRARHRTALTDAVASLRRAIQETLPELAAEDVRGAVRAVGRITGRVDVEAMLDALFHEFCIGK